MLIGLTGYARSGKDSVADVMVSDLGFGRAAYADALREGLLVLDPYLGLDQTGRRLWRLSDEIALVGWEGSKAREWGQEIRRLLQRFGTEAGRDIHGDNTWVNALFRCAPQKRNTVITDVRFLNEALAVQKRGGVIVRVVRPGVAMLNQHASEMELDLIKPDLTLLNNGTLLDLENTVVRLLDFV